MEPFYCSLRWIDCQGQRLHIGQETLDIRVNGMFYVLLELPATGKAFAEARLTGDSLRILKAKKLDVGHMTNALITKVRAYADEEVTQLLNQKKSLGNKSRYFLVAIDTFQHEVKNILGIKEMGKKAANGSGYGLQLCSIQCIRNDCSHGLMSVETGIFEDSLLRNTRAEAGYACHITMVNFSQVGPDCTRPPRQCFRWVDLTPLHFLAGKYKENCVIWSDKFQRLDGDRVQRTRAEAAERLLEDNIRELANLWNDAEPERKALLEASMTEL